MRLGAAGLMAAVAASAGAPGCHGRASALVPTFDAAATVTAPAPTEEPEAVHFSFTGPTSAAFSWQGSGHVFRFWSKNIPPRTLQSHAPSPAPFSSGGPWQEVDVTGMVPGVEYRYMIGSPERPVTGPFAAPPPPGASGFVVAAMGDVGASSDWPEVRTTHRLVSLAEPAFVLMLGDLTYADARSQTSVDKHFEDVMAWSRRAAYMPAWGNHEWQEPRRDDLRNYKGRFMLPHPQASKGAPVAGCCGEDWYWFDYGNARFIVYPEPYTGDTWPEWAARAEPLFAAAERDPALRFVVTAGHRPAYSSGTKGGDAQLRGILDGFGKRFPKYVLNLAAHEHAYERSKPQAHVVHVTAGIGGATLERADTPCKWPQCKAPAYSAYRAIHHGFVKLFVRADIIRIEGVCGAAVPATDDIRCAEGDIMDQVTIAAGGS